MNQSPTTPVTTRLATLAFALLATLTTLSGIDAQTGAEAVPQMAQAVATDKA